MYLSPFIYLPGSLIYPYIYLPASLTIYKLILVIVGDGDEVAFQHALAISFGSEPVSLVGGEVVTLVVEALPSAGTDD